MIESGHYYNLQIKRFAPPGAYLSTPDGNEILLPKKWTPEGIKENDTVEVFVYTDSEDRQIATTQQSLATSGTAAVLEVNGIAGVGAFLSIGLDKDILLPLSEMKHRLQIGDQVLVYVYNDRATNRMVATENINKFIKNRELTVKVNEQVQLLIGYHSGNGYRVIVNNAHWGMIYDNELFTPVETGEIHTGYVKKIREDNKLDIALQKQGLAAATDLGGLILQKLEEQNGFLPLHDHSPAEEIYNVLGCSKKNFKKAIGMLLKKGKIQIKENGIAKSLTPQNKKNPPLPKGKKG